MEERIFIQYLKNFSALELRKFAVFAKEELSKAEEKRALHYILTCILEDMAIEESRLIDFLASTQQKANARIKKFFNHSTRIVENYLVSQEIKREDNKLLHDVMLLKHLNRSKEESLFNHCLQKTVRAEKKNAALDVFSSLSRLLWTHEAFFHPLLDNVKAPLPSVRNIAHQIDSLDRAHLLSKLKYTVTEIVRGRLEKKSPGLPFLQELLEDSEKYCAEAFPLVYLYRSSLLLFTEFDENGYLKFKEKVLELIPKKLLQLAEKELLFRLLVNQTAQAIRFDKKYLEVGLENYRFGISHNLLHQQGFLPQEHFFNYITLACSFGRLRAANRFIQDLQHKLHPSKKNQVVTISNALVLLAEKKYKEAFLSLCGKNFKDPHLRLIARSNRLMACYEWDKNALDVLENKGDFITIKDEIESFKRVILRLKAKLGKTNERIIVNENFIQMVRTLEKTSNSLLSPVVKDKLRKQLSRYKLIACRKWLEEKIEEL